jgi:AAA domain
MSNALTTASAIEWRRERDRNDALRPAHPKPNIIDPPWKGFDADEAAPPPPGPDDYGDASLIETKAEKVIKFTPTPFKWRDPSTFPRRQFIYGRHLIRQFLSATVAQGGVGKSSLSIAEIVAMASGRDLLGCLPTKPLRVWYWNGEDPQEEIERRVEAARLHYGIDPAEIEGRLFLDNGRDTEIIIATQTKTGTVIATPVEDALVTALIEGQFDALILDPLVSTHRVSENDNMAIDAVAKTFGRIAGKANVAIEGVHHSRKTGGAAATSEDSRGASAWVDAGRSVRVLNRMSEGEASSAGVNEDERRFYFRSEIDKANLVPPAKATWFKLASVPLGNGSGEGVDDQDYVGVATAWTWPDAFEGVTVDDLRRVQDAVAAGRWRENLRSKDWVGVAVANVLRLDIENKAHRAKIIAILKTWIANGMFVVVEGLDSNRVTRTFIEVGNAGK